MTLFVLVWPFRSYGADNETSVPVRLANPNAWMAIVGDSGVTGAASAMDIQPNAWNLARRALPAFLSGGELVTLPPPPLSDFPNPARFRISEVEPMTRVVFSAAEYDRAASEGHLMRLNLKVRAFLNVDVQEHSNGYMVGRALGIRSRDIVLVGEDGARVSSIPEQFARIFEMSTETLPPLVLISFTANDMCDFGVFTEPVAERRARFQASLEEAWKAAKPHLRAHPKGTRVLVLEPFEVTLALTNPQMLSQKIWFQGAGEITCADLRERTTLSGPFSVETARRLGKMCPAVLMTRPTETENVRRLVEIQRAFTDVWKVQVAALNREYRGQGIEWEFLDGIHTIPPEQGDLANDCFHPSVRAHAKVADFILKTAFER